MGETYIGIDKDYYECVCPNCRSTIKLPFQSQDGVDWKSRYEELKRHITAVNSQLLENELINLIQECMVYEMITNSGNFHEVLDHFENVLDRVRSKRDRDEK
jgi:hypothetical protein